MFKALASVVRRPGAVLAGALAVMIGAGHAPAVARELDGNDIRRKVTGKRIYLAVPLGGEFPLFYRRDGRVDGTGEALGLGRFVRPTDQGRWWVQGNSLCQQWEVWYEGKVMCFTLTDLGNSRLKWLQDNGDTGTARIGN
jgi:hypothetical protein